MPDFGSGLRDAGPPRQSRAPRSISATERPTESRALQCRGVNCAPQDGQPGTPSGKEELRQHGTTTAWRLRPERVGADVRHDDDRRPGLASPRWAISASPRPSRMLDVCRDAGVTTIDTADAYSFGGAEEILGQALDGRRHRVRARHQGRSCAWGPGRTTSASRASTSIEGLRGQPAPAAHRLPRSLHQPPAGHAACRSTRPCARSTTSCGRARSATSAARITPPGT